MADVLVRFQSLIGISQILIERDGKAIAPTSVSIPNRDFTNFDHHRSAIKSTTSNVSIPNRDFTNFDPIHRLGRRLWQVSIPNRDFTNFDLRGIYFLRRTRRFNP